MGVANSDAKLYDDELQEILATYPEQVGMRAAPCPRQAPAGEPVVACCNRHRQYDMQDVPHRGCSPPVMCMCRLCCFC